MASFAPLRNWTALLAAAFLGVASAQVPTDLTSARFARNCGAANVTQIFADGFLGSGQAGITDMNVVSDPDVVLIGNQWWLIFASNPGPTRGIEPVAAYLPPGVSLSYTGVYPADPNGWHLVNAAPAGTGIGVAVDGNVSPAGWDTIAAETPSVDVGPDGKVAVYYAGHNLGNTNFQIGLMSNVVNGVAASIDPVPAIVATEPWEFANGLGAILEQSVRWQPELNKFLMYYTVKGWWDTPPDNDVAYAESADGITWTNRQKLGFPVSYYNQDFVFNPQWNRYEMVISNDPTGQGGANGRDIVWLDSAGPGTSYSAWQNQVTLLDHTSPGTPMWRDQGLLSPAVKYGNLPGEENRIYVFFHAYGSSDPMSVARFYCDATTTAPGYTLSAGATGSYTPYLNLAPGGSGSLPITIRPTNGFSQTVNLALSGAPVGVTATLSPSAWTNGTAGTAATVSMSVGANVAQGRYPITVTGTSADGLLTRQTVFTLNVSGLSQTISIAPLPTGTIPFTQGQTFTINATASSNLPVSLSVGGNGTLNGNVLTVIGGGDIIVAANQAGNATYSPAPQVTATLQVAPETQTINVAPIPSQIVGGTLNLDPYMSTSSGLTGFSYTSNTPGVCNMYGSTAVFTSVGQCTIIVIQFGSQFYAPVGVDAYITVNQAPQTITFPTISSQTAGGTLVPTATASSGLPVSFSVIQNGNCSINGGAVTFLHVGACGIVANQAGNANYAAATAVGQVVLVGVGNPSITFAIPDTHTLASTIALAAVSNSTGPITYSVLSGPATVSGSTLTLTGGGVVKVQASQVATGDFNAGVSVTTFNSIAGSVWLGSTGSLGTLDLTGALISPANGFTGGGLGVPAGAQAMAINSDGSLWVANQGGAISKFNRNGSAATGSPFTVTGLSSPTALAVDGSSQVWVVNAIGSVVSLSNAGAVVSTATDASISGATGIAVDNSGSVWVSNSSTNTVDEIIGIAAPTAAVANALQNGTVGVKP
jgi:streptogramin lyase